MTLKTSKLLTDGLSKLNINYNNKMIEQFYDYLSLYYEWNKKVNISSILEEEQIITRHFLDSISPLAFLKDINIKSLPCVDLGAGGGFPGIPLKIIEPKMDLDLAEVNKKKICFLKKVILDLNLSNVNIIDSSCSIPNKSYRLLLTRAFGSLNKILKEAKNYITKGYIVAYKGRINKINNEITDLPSEVSDKLFIKRIISPFLNEERHIVVMNI